MVRSVILSRGFQHTAARRRLGLRASYDLRAVCGFNTQPPEGGWCNCYTDQGSEIAVSTHSRPKAAGYGQSVQLVIKIVSTHSRPKAAGSLYGELCVTDFMFQHTAARRRLGQLHASAVVACRFQHTAARRRLGPDTALSAPYTPVSTHSRPKAAGLQDKTARIGGNGFNTQPPEGGWQTAIDAQIGQAVSTHSRPKAAGRIFWPVTNCPKKFQHTAARRRLELIRYRPRPKRLFQHTAARRRLGYQYT